MEKFKSISITASKMQGTKSIADFTIKNWKNVGVFLILLGLLTMIFAEDLKLGGSLLIVGVVFTGLFQGPKIFKILKRKNW
ncbi:hypothetical protein HYX13_05910 [Candidatus Woesearchaeota archaeon]|nr:hypothetical protein [Candidatus Woesearchaeota archaeon]